MLVVVDDDVLDVDVLLVEEVVVVPPENVPPDAFTFIAPTFAKLVGLAHPIVVQ
jgi:hypothetical protein